MKGLRISLVLLVVLFVLGGVAYWDEQQQKKEELQEKSRSKLLTMSSSEVVEVNLVNHSTSSEVESFQLKKQNGSWDIVKPVSYKGNDDTINRWIKTFEDLKYEKVFEPKTEEVAAYGLESPLLELTIGFIDGSKRTVVLGSKSPTGYSNYLRLSGDNRVYLVGHYVFTASNKKLNDVRERGLGVLDLADTTRIDLESSSKLKVSFIKNEDVWNFNEPGDLQKLDETKLKEFVESLKKASIETFLDEPSADLRRALSLDHGGTQKLGQIVQTSSKGIRKEWIFLENNGVVYLKLAGYDGFATLGKQVADIFEFKGDHFEDKKIFDFSSSEVSRIELNGRKFEKIKDKWVGIGDAQSELMRLFLVDLEFLEAKQFLASSDAFNGQRKIHKISLYRDQEKIASFDIYEKEASTNFVYLVTGSKSALVDRKILENLSQIEQVQKADSMSKRHQD